MKYTSKVVYDEADATNFVLVYYKPKGINIKGNLIHSVDGTYYKRNDGKVFPVLLDGNGIWMTVIDETGI